MSDDAMTAREAARILVDLAGTADDEVIQAVATVVNRLAELERQVADAPVIVGTRTEWAVGDPDDCASDDDVNEVANGPYGLTTTDRDFGRSLLVRTAHLGPWTAAS